MITVEQLKDMGVDTNEGLTRCMNNESFYFRMIKMGLSDKHFDELETLLQKDDRAAAFESAHALKGVLGNLALTPLYKPMAEITELLRAKKEADYNTMYAVVKETREKLLAMCD